MSGKQRPPRRAVVPAVEAARLLQRDVRTVRRMIQTNEIDGYEKQANSRSHWYVYADQLPGAVAAPVAGTSVEDQLRAENAQLRAELASAYEVIRLSQAAQAIATTAVQDYRQAAELDDVVAEGLRVAMEGVQQVVQASQSKAGRFKASADGFAQALEHERDALALLIAPDNIGDLDSR